MSIIRKEQLSNPLSASYALTASFAENANVTINTSSLVTTSSFNAFTASINNFTSSYNTGSFSGSFTGNLNGTASFAGTASYVNPLRQNVQITGSLFVSNSIDSSDRYLLSTNGGISVDWNNKVLRDGTPQTYPSVDWNSRQLLDSSTNLSIDWDNRALQSDNSKIIWDNDALYPDVDDIVNLGIADTNRFRYGYFARDVYAGGFVGDLTGTASYATQVLSSSFSFTASWANNTQTASYVNPLNQNVLISGSLKLDPTQDPDPLGLDTDSTILFQSASNTSLGYDLYIRQNGNLVKWKWVEGIIETGLLYGGVVTYSGSNVFVSSGSGIIAEHNASTTQEIAPTITYVTWGPITQSIANIATQQVTYLYIDNTGTLQQQSSRFTTQQYHESIPLGAVGHFDYTRVSVFGGQVQTAYDQISQISNFLDAFGPLKISGYGLTGQANSLRLSVGGGTSFIHGGFYESNPEYPSQITTPSQATASLARVYRSGSSVIFDTNGGNLYTTVNPTQYDRDGDGTLATVGSGNWSVQRVFSDPKTGVLYIYYGQERYTTLLNALQYLPTDPFTEGDTFDFTTFVGYLVLRGNASDLTDTNNNSIVNGGLFRGSGQGSGGGIAISNLDDLTDVSITSAVDGQALIYNSGLWINGIPATASYTLTSSFASTASLATTASYAIQTLSASFASTSSFNPNAIVTASVSLNTITFTKGDNSTFPITVNTGSSSPASSVTQSFRLQSNALTFAGSSGNRFTLLTSPVNAGSEGVTQLYMEYGITLKQLLVRTTNSQPASGAITIALRKNGVDTALLVTIPANAAAGNFSSSADIPLVTGDLINYRINNAATATSTNIIQISLLYT